MRGLQRVLELVLGWAGVTLFLLFLQFVFPPAASPCPADGWRWEVGGGATVCNTVVACQLGDWRVTERVAETGRAMIAIPAWIWHRGRDTGQDQHNISFLKTLIGIRPPAKTVLSLSSSYVEETGDIDMLSII